jgi:hypothetical protein
VGAEDIVGQFLGDPLEIGSKGFHLGMVGALGLASHPWPPAKGKSGNKNKGRIPQTIRREKTIVKLGKPISNSLPH